MSSSRKKPVTKEPITAPKVLTAYRAPMFRPSLANSLPANLLRTGRVPPIRVVGTRMTMKDRRNLTIATGKGCWPKVSKTPE